jgi:hypothetical protein
MMLKVNTPEGTRYVPGHAILDVLVKADGSGVVRTAAGLSYTVRDGDQVVEALQKTPTPTSVFEAIFGK